MVFFKVTVIADRGQYAWDEWLGEAIPENLLDYKIQDIRVRSGNSATYLEHLPTSGEMALMLPSVLFLSPSVGQHGLGVLETGAEPSGPVCTASFWDQGPLPPWRQPLEGVLLFLHQPAYHSCCWCHSNLHPAKSLPWSKACPDIATAKKKHFSSCST